MRKKVNNFIENKLFAGNNLYINTKNLNFK